MRLPDVATCAEGSRPHARYRVLVDSRRTRHEAANPSCVPPRGPWRSPRFRRQHSRSMASPMRPARASSARCPSGKLRRRHPVRCWTEYTEGSGANRTAGAVIGGIAGGLIGHQFGSRSGNTAATIAGTIGGAAVGGRDRASQRRSARGGALPHRVRVRGSRRRLRRRLPVPGSRLRDAPALTILAGSCRST